MDLKRAKLKNQTKIVEETDATNSLSPISVTDSRDLSAPTDSLNCSNAQSISELIAVPQSQNIRLLTLAVSLFASYTLCFCWHGIWRTYQTFSFLFTETPEQHAGFTIARIARMAFHFAQEGAILGLLGGIFTAIPFMFLRSRKFSYTFSAVFALTFNLFASFSMALISSRFWTLPITREHDYAALYQAIIMPVFHYESFLCVLGGLAALFVLICPWQSICLRLTKPQSKQG